MTPLVDAAGNASREDERIEWAMVLAALKGAEVNGIEEEESD